MRLVALLVWQCWELLLEQPMGLLLVWLWERLMGQPSVLLLDMHSALGWGVLTANELVLLWWALQSAQPTAFGLAFPSGAQ
jgi:hypothetical protein